MARSFKRTMLGMTLAAAAVVAGLYLVFSPWSPFTAPPGHRASGTGNAGGGGVLGVITDAADSVQQWVGRQLLAIANDHLGPTLAFERIDYRAPDTIELTGVTLTEEDTRLLTADSIRIQLARTPAVGQPILIQNVTLNAPVVHVIENEAGEIRGFDTLVKRGSGSAKEDGGSTKLQDVFSIRSISILQGEVIYQRPGEPIMRIDGLTTALTVQRAADREGSWYTMLCNIDRSPVAGLTIVGALDIDTLLMDVSDFKLSADLAPEQYELLPPSVQVLLDTYKVRGTIAATGSGVIPLRDLASLRLNAECEMTDVFLAIGAYRMQVQHGRCAAELSSGVLAVRASSMRAFDGEVDVAAKVEFAGEQPFEAQIAARKVSGDQLFARLHEDESITRGRVTGSVQMAGRNAAADPKLKLAGAGELTFENARLAQVPVIDGLVKAMKRATSYGEPTDRGSAQFELFHNRLQLNTLEYISQSIAARGEGDVFYDGSLDLKLNAGPLERVQSALGAVGELFGKVTDKLVSYRVTGTLDQPKYAVEPLGIKLKVPFLGGKSEDKE